MCIQFQYGRGERETVLLNKKFQISSTKIVQIPNYKLERQDVLRRFIGYETRFDAARLTGDSSGENFEGGIKVFFQMIFVIINQPFALFPENDTGKQRPDNVGHRIRPAG